MYESENINIDFAELDQVSLQVSKSENNQLTDFIGRDERTRVNARKFRACLIHSKRQRQLAELRHQKMT